MCSNTSIQEIEDSITNNRNNNIIELANKNYEVYRTIVIDLFKWLQDQKENYKKLYYNNFEDIDYFRKNFTNVLNKEFRKTKFFVKKSILLYIYDKLIQEDILENDEIFRILLQTRPARGISGITSVTLLTSPHPHGQKYSCKHNCYYCPDEKASAENNWQDQPRSYLYKEPAVSRANRNNFEATDQMNDRLNELFTNGHEIDKIEMILEGGTYTEYPEKYLEEFNRDIFYIANTFWDANPKRPALSIQEEIEINKTARTHIIGICIETRPDAIDEQWLNNFRNWGITRIQLGVQHTDNEILKKINRGHTIEQAQEAIEYLKDNCFKIDIHLMPDLPGANPDKDNKMFEYVYKEICPDQIKIYPCEVVPWTIIEKWYKDGKYIPYFEKNPRDLLDVIKNAMKTCPNYIRFPRIIRDIPLSYIESGNTFPNLRQMLDNELEKEGLMCGDIRTHEIAGEDGNTPSSPSKHDRQPAASSDDGCRDAAAQDRIKESRP